MAFDLIELWRAGEGGYHTYRIPSLIRTAGGDLLAICEGRRHSPSDHGKIDLVSRRSGDDGRNWSPTTVIWSDPGDDVTIGNPCPVVEASTGQLLLPCTRNNRRVLLLESDDDGRTWSEPREIGDAVRPDWDWVATGPGVGIQLRHGRYTGRILIPCDHRPVEPATGSSAPEGAGLSSSHAMISDDHGRMWRIGQSIGPGSNECQATERQDGSVMMNMRMQRLGRGCRAVSLSTDGGESWSTLEHDGTLIDPICQASLIRMEQSSAAGDGPVPWWFFSNPASTTREGMTVRRSPDEGATWPMARVIHAGPAGYSSLAPGADGAILCLFEAGRANYREQIVLTRIEAAAW